MIDDFVEKTKTSQKNEQLVIDIKSHALRRQLARDIGAKYKVLGNIFTEFKKNSDQFIIKKWYKRNDYGKTQNKS